ncbi:unnamed protein product, partial [Ectocarpus sp. 8 AP-2014]
MMQRRMSPLFFPTSGGGSFSLRQWMPATTTPAASKRSS